MSDHNQQIYPSHYLVLVNDLHQAVKDYEHAGFTVVWGSAPETSHNALIYFEQGGFIELFNPLPPGIKGQALKIAAAMGSLAGVPMMKRFKLWAGSPGLCDYALETHKALGPALEAAMQRGASFDKIRNFKRQQVDGTLTRWQLAVPLSPELPFVMGPYDPPPDITDADRTHQNGAPVGLVHSGGAF
ncbi:MAG: VOC family protein [Pseudomonadota bacterium]